MTAQARTELSPRIHAPPPARDERFHVVERWIDCAAFPDGSPEREIEFLHRQMHEEVNAVESSARTLVDFPEADWQLRLDLARQCSDESRHARMFRRVLERRGGFVGQYPVLCFQYRIIVAIDTLIGRLTVQNRSFEAGGIDAIEDGIAEARREDEQDLVALFEAQLADEVVHVRFANAAIAALNARDPRHLLRMGAALTQAAQGFREVMGTEGTEGAHRRVSGEARREAGFSAEEIRLADQLAERLVSRPKTESAKARDAR
jgi:uncharacterized ferritin-like protein (DUF455 family)